MMAIKKPAKLTKAKLPYPRLELRWRKPTEDELAESDISANMACDYVLVLHKKHNGDARCNTEKGAAKVDVEYVLNTTMRGGGFPLVHNGVVDTPYRDGAHAMWDAEVLDLPAFAIYGKDITGIEIRE